MRLVAGLRNRSIADRLSMGEGIVKVHMLNIYENLDVNGRVKLHKLRP